MKNKIILTIAAVLVAATPVIAETVERTVKCATNEVGWCLSGGSWCGWKSSRDSKGNETVATPNMKCITNAGYSATCGCSTIY